MKEKAITSLIIGVLFCLLVVDASWSGVVPTNNQSTVMPASCSAPPRTPMYGVHNRDGTTTMFVGDTIITYRTWAKLKWVNTSGEESEMDGTEIWVNPLRWSNPDTYGQGGHWEAAGMTIEILDSDGKVVKTLEIAGNTILLPELYSLIYQAATGSKQQIVAGDGGYEVTNTDNLPFWQTPAETIGVNPPSSSGEGETSSIQTKGMPAIPSGYFVTEGKFGNLRMPWLAQNVRLYSGQTAIRFIPLDEMPTAELRDYFSSLLPQAQSTSVRQQTQVPKGLPAIPAGYFVTEGTFGNLTMPWLAQEVKLYNGQTAIRYIPLNEMPTEELRDYFEDLLNEEVGGLPK